MSVSFDQVAECLINDNYQHSREFLPWYLKLIHKYIYTTQLIVVTGAGSDPWSVLTGSNADHNILLTTFRLFVILVRVIIYYLHTIFVFLCFGHNLITENTRALDCFPVCIQVDALVSYFCLFKSLKFLVGPSTFIPIHSIPITHSIPSSADFKLQILLSWGFIVPERSLKMLTCPHSRLQCQNKNTRLWIYIAVNWLVCHHSVKTDKSLKIGIINENILYMTSILAIRR